jgi:hypothetical protein
MARNALIQLRRDTAANWTSTNPTLAAGEMGFETDTGKLKIGTGSTVWTSLLYVTDASPRGVMALATSQTNYTLTTSLTATTGMSVTFTAVANRRYKITYYEPEAQTADIPIQVNTEIDIRLTNAAGASQGTTIIFSPQYIIKSALTVIAIKTFTAGSVTLVGCAKTSDTTGSPALVRTAPRSAILLVEDIGAV